jgi:hypothetical protein
MKYNQSWIGVQIILKGLLKGYSLECIEDKLTHVGIDKCLTC